jgi:hypothetical protein
VIVQLYIAQSAYGADSGDAIELSTGAYSLTASSSTKNGNHSGAGIYHIMYHHRFFDQFSISLGYTIFMSDIISGDMGFGPDISLYYYPFSNSGKQYASDDGTSIQIQESLRPFVGLGFHQRQFQSVSTSYAGYGGYIGADYQWSDHLVIRGEGRYLSLNGSGETTAKQIDFLLGILIDF